MATIKSFTDLEQSKKLAEILPLESADAIYEYYGAKLETPTLIEKPIYWLVIKGFESRCRFSTSKKDIPCWSLAALLSVLPIIDDEFEPQLHRSFDRYRCTYEGEEDSIGLWRVADNPVDACYEMIMMLNELKLL